MFIISVLVWSRPFTERIELIKACIGKGLVNVQVLGSADLASIFNKQNVGIFFKQIIFRHRCVIYSSRILDRVIKFKEF